MKLKKWGAVLLAAMVFMGTAGETYASSNDLTPEERAEFNKTYNRIKAQREAYIRELNEWYNAQSEEYKREIMGLYDKERLDKLHGDFQRWKATGQNPVSARANLSQFPKAPDYSNEALLDYNYAIINDSNHKIVSCILENRAAYASRIKSGVNLPLREEVRNQQLDLTYWGGEIIPLTPGQHKFIAVARAEPGNSSEHMIVLFDNNKVLETNYLPCENVAYYITDNHIDRLALPKDANEAKEYTDRIVAVMQHKI